MFCSSRADDLVAMGTQAKGDRWNNFMRLITSVWGLEEVDSGATLVELNSNIV